MESSGLSHLDLIRYDRSTMKIRKNMMAMITIMCVAYG